MTRNEGLKVTQEQLRESQANVAEARAAFLPSLDLNFLYTPAQASPLLRIPAGVFGPTEQTFRANFTRENIVRFDISQPLYTGGRLEHAYGAQAATQEASRLDVERAQQGLTLRVYETFYAALMADQGVRVTDEGVESPSGISSWRRCASRRDRRRGSTFCARKWSWRTRAPS